VRHAAGCIREPGDAPAEPWMHPARASIRGPPRRQWPLFCRGRIRIDACYLLDRAEAPLPSPNAGAYAQDSIMLTYLSERRNIAAKHGIKRR
jgi:hypothetical protein